MTTFESGTAIAGQAFTLFCRVVLSEDVVRQPEITWLSPQGETLITEDELTVGLQEITGNPSRLTTYMAQFNPVMTSNAGNYICQATVYSPYGTIQRTVTNSHNVTVESELFSLS